MDISTPAELVPKIVEILSPLESADRQRVLQAVLMLMGETALPQSKANTAGTDLGIHDTSEEFAILPPKAKLWMKQNDLSVEELQEAFQVSEGKAEFIGTMPGKNKREQTRNAYELMGLTKLLASGDTAFTDKEARKLCEIAGCYDRPNHAVIMKDKGNSLSGSKEAGWSLTAPGLKHAASLIKGMNGKS